MIEREALFQSVTPQTSLSLLLHAMYEQNEWMLQPMLAMLEPSMLRAYLDRAGEIWDLLRGVRPIDEGERVAEVVRGLQFHTIEFLKLQLQFARTGEYKSSDFEQVNHDVYGSQPVMRQYLDGLLLTYIAWPNHYRLLDFYEREYLARGPYGPCLEIGPGHGWLARQQLRASAQNTLLALDVSPHSVQYTSQTLRASGIDPSRHDVREGDALRGIPGDRRFARIVLGEVLEHVEQPDRLLALLVERALPDALVFVTTVVNIEAVDHIYLFRELQEVRDLLGRCGLRIVSELDLPLVMNLRLERPAYEVALICTPACDCNGVPSEGSACQPGLRQLR